MAIANGMCVSLGNQSKAHFGLPALMTVYHQEQGLLCWDFRVQTCNMTEKRQKEKEDSMLVKCIAAYIHLPSTVYEL